MIFKFDYFLLTMEKNFDYKKIEEKWQKKWEEEGIYHFDEKSEKPTFSIDTPPPYASGDLHVGHVKNFTEMDAIARYKRMKGFNVFFPVGVDDNGLPTEKYVEKNLGITKDSVSRDEFVKKCLEVADEMYNRVMNTFKRVGISIDTNYSYRTIKDKAVYVAQKSFVELYKKGLLERKVEPTLWCPYHQTALAQAVVEDKEKETFLNYLKFKVKETGEILEIATTRPELLPSCVAVFVNPADEKRKHLIGKHAVVPLYNFEVPIIADEDVDLEFGTGAVMVCTFGDSKDVEWWKKHKLPLKVSINKDGTMKEIAGKYAGMKIEEARKAIIEDLKKEGILFDQEKIKQTVGTCWRCHTPIEYIPTEQWFIKIVDHKDDLIEAGKKINWNPKFYEKRYEDWVKNLKWDWCISRQRYYGVPFPVWYCKDCGHIIVADENELPIDPLKTKPAKCPKCGSTNIVPETDVMDTWMTSSMTPVIPYGWDENLLKKLYPMSLRAQSHDIIRTWAFYTIVKGLYHFNQIPWSNVLITGFVYAAKGVEMHKSLGTGIDPHEKMDKYGVDAVRYWTTTSGLGEDLIYNEQDLIRGKKIINKLWNAARFISMHMEDVKEPKLREVDKWILTKLNETIEKATEYFDKFEVSKARKVTENFFMHDFCDNYLEMIKWRVYNNVDESGAKYTIYHVLKNVLKLFAPIMPYVTEEIYRELYEDKTIHLSNWPEAKWDFGVKLPIDEILYAGRKAKAEKNLSVGAKVNKIKIHGPKISEEVVEDIKNTLRANEIEYIESNEISAVIE